MTRSDFTAIASAAAVLLGLMALAGLCEAMFEAERMNETEEAP